MTREQLLKLRAMVCAFEYQAQIKFSRADSTMDEESEAYEKAGRAYRRCSRMLERTLSEMESEQ